MRFSSAENLKNEPLVTLSEDKGLVVRIADNFITDFQVTSVYYNADFAKAKPEAAKSFIIGFLKGCRDLQGNGWKDDANAKIIEKYTKVAADVVKVGVIAELTGDIPAVGASCKNAAELALRNYLGRFLSVQL